MENSELMFDKDSFSDLKTPEEAQSAYTYYVHNLTTFRSRLLESGMSYSEEDKLVRQCWVNLIESCKKAGYTNSHLQRMAELYKVG